MLPYPGYENMFKDLPILCIFGSIFGNTYGVRGSTFGYVFGRSRNVPKSIAIDQESLISVVGKIKTPQKTHNDSKNKEKQNNMFVFAVFWALLNHFCRAHS